MTIEVECFLYFQRNIKDLSIMTIEVECFLYFWGNIKDLMIQNL